MARKKNTGDTTVEQRDLGNEIITIPSIYQRIFQYLAPTDRLNCATVNKVWYASFRDAMDKNNLIVTPSLLDELKKDKSNIRSFVDEHYTFSTDLTIKGWMNRPKDSVIPSEIYDDLLRSNLRTKRLVLQGRGRWESCKCPKVKSTCGEQVDTIKEEDLTNIESILITSTFSISACALLDLVSRSPKLKTLKFYGILENADHCNSFKSTRFYSDLESVHWPWATKKDRPVIQALVKRNDNIVTFFSSQELACELLAADSLPSVKNLSLNLNQDWYCKPKKTRKVYKYVNDLDYLNQAKNVEALEVRTYDISSDSLDMMNEETLGVVEKNFELYKLKFWEKVSKLPKLKYLAIYGAWELESSCREMAKHGLQIEYLKINLMPNSVIAALSNNEDSPILSMDEALRCLKKLSKLKSLHLICAEKLSNIDRRTIVVMKEFSDRLWAFDIKTALTTEIEELLNHYILRGRQTHKQYSVSLNVVPREVEYSDILIEHPLKHSQQIKLTDKLQTVASHRLTRYNCSLDQSYLWGLKYYGHLISPNVFEELSKTWQYYSNNFDIDLNYI